MRLQQVISMLLQALTTNLQLISSDSSLKVNDPRELALSRYQPPKKLREKKHEWICLKSKERENLILFPPFISKLSLLRNVCFLWWNKTRVSLKNNFLSWKYNLLNSSWNLWILLPLWRHNATMIEWRELLQWMGVYWIISGAKLD